MKLNFLMASVMILVAGVACPSPLFPAISLGCWIALPIVQDESAGNGDDANGTANNGGIQTIKPNEATSTIGFPRLIYQYVIAGPKVAAKPFGDRAQPLTVRIVDTYPHGSDFRYDIEYQGLEPGSFNLADYLVRDEGSNTPIPPILVEVHSLLGEGQVAPTELPKIRSRFRSRYYLTLVGLGVVWFIGLIVILFYGRKRKKQRQAIERPLTVADRLRPLIDLAIAGDLDAQQSAELERVLSAFWCKKLALDELSANELRERLRDHSEASVMLNQIDAWLHRPSSDSANRVDVNEMLEPYRSMKYEEV